MVNIVVPVNRKNLNVPDMIPCDMLCRKIQENKRGGISD